MLRRFAATVCDRDMEADDVLQDALAATLRVERSGTRILHHEAYIKRAILNQVKMRRRAHARRSQRGVPLAQDHADAYPSDIRSVLDLASAKERAVLYL